MEKCLEITIFPSIHEQKWLKIGVPGRDEFRGIVGFTPTNVPLWEIPI